MSTAPAKRRFVLFGVGGVSRSVIPILIQKCKDIIEEFVVYDMVDLTEPIKKMFEPIKMTYNKRVFNYKTFKQDLLEIIKENDVVMELFGMTTSQRFVEACSEVKGVVFANASLEEFDEDIIGSQYANYKRLYDYKKISKSTNTCVVDSGANPGLITHFAKLALLGMAESAVKRGVADKDIIKELLDKKDLKGLAKQMKVDVVHSSDIDTTEPRDEKIFDGKFVNTWCIPSYMEEYNTPSEVSLGTADTKTFEGPGFKIEHETDPASVVLPINQYLKSAYPGGVFIGKTTKHPETMEISNIFASPDFSPTVVFVYRACRLARKSAKFMDFKTTPNIIMDEITNGPLTGFEAMGALLISSREDIPMRYCGSVLSNEQTRQIYTKTNCTLMQVVAGYVSHLIYAINHPNLGICNPGDFESDKILEIARPYLGTVADQDLDFRLPTDWNQLLTTEEELNKDIK